MVNKNGKSYCNECGKLVFEYEIKTSVFCYNSNKNKDCLVKHLNSKAENEISKIETEVLTTLIKNDRIFFLIKVNHNDFNYNVVTIFPHNIKESTRFEEFINYDDANNHLIKIYKINVNNDLIDL